MLSEAKKKLIIITLLCSSSIARTFNHEPIDVVIPCHEKDLRSLELVISGAKKFCRNIRRIVVVSERRLTHNAEWFDEALYPFNQKSILTVIFNGDEQRAQTYQTEKKNRTGWIYQQLLKLYAPFVIPDISSNVLIIDADVIFLKPVSFIDEKGFALYNFGAEYTPEYFAFGNRLLPGFKKVFPKYSGICHHMLMQRSILEKLFKTIETVHGCEPWVAICRCIDHKNIFAPFSEYELYFNYVFASGEKVKLRELNYRDLDVQNPSKVLAYLKQNPHHYVAWHSRQ